MSFHERHTAMSTIHQPPVTHRSATPATFDPEGITEQTAPYFRAAPSPLSLLHPDLAFATGRLYTDAGFTPAEVVALPGDKTFNREAAGVMAVLEASGLPARRNCSLCGGSGQVVEGHDCPRCLGSGQEP